MKNVSNFKLFGHPMVQLWMQDHLFGKDSKFQKLFFGNGILFLIMALVLILIMVIYLIKKSGKQ